MAAGDTALSICSDALILLGAAPLSSFTEGTDAAQACDRLYPDLRDPLLSNYQGSWSVKKEQLARLTTAPTNEYISLVAVALLVYLFLSAYSVVQLVPST